MKTNLEFVRPAVAAIGLFALAGVLPAHAADVIMEEPPVPAAPMEVPPLNTWSGPYAGVTVGYGFGGETEIEDGVSTTVETDGFNAGGFVGYNYQVGNVVVGAEGDLGYSWADGENGPYTSESGVEGSLRARLGYAVSPNILLYATAGGAGKQLEVTDTVGGATDDNTMLGWTAGAGADVMVTEQVFGRVEYRYTDFGNEDFGTAEVSDKDHRVLFGLGVKF